MTQDSPTPKRVTKRLRFEIFRRDGFRCRYCGTTASDAGEGLTIDHVMPVSLGGGNEPSNLVTACVDCNSGKTSSAPDAPLVGQVAEDAQRMAAAMRAVADSRRAQARTIDDAVDMFIGQWDESKAGYLPADWEVSVSRFAEAGLNGDDLARFVRVTAASQASHYDHFRYFCGCCWNETNKRQALATELVGVANLGPVGQAAPVEGIPTVDSMLYDLGTFLGLARVGRRFAVDFAQHCDRYGVDATDVIDGYDDSHLGDPSDLAGILGAFAGGHCGDAIEAG